jgi:hypothetical protein
LSRLILSILTIIYVECKGGYIKVIVHLSPFWFISTVKYLNPQNNDVYIRCKQCLSGY